MPTNGGRRRGARGVVVKSKQSLRAPISTALEADFVVVPTAPGKHHFRLVQRLERHDRPDLKGLAGMFDLDYMGHAEFEVGTVPESLMRIRQTEDLKLIGVEMTCETVTRTVWFVGPSEGMEDKISDFKVWLSKGCRSLTWTNFERVFRGDAEHLKRIFVTTDSWWSLRDDIAWTLDEGIARKLHEGFAPLAD